jgi:hypothetical protein
MGVLQSLLTLVNHEKSLSHPGWLTLLVGWRNIAAGRKKRSQVVPLKDTFVL